MSFYTLEYIGQTNSDTAWSCLRTTAVINPLAHPGSVTQKPFSVQFHIFPVRHAEAIKSFLMFDTDHNITTMPPLHMHTFKDIFNMPRVSQDFPGPLTARSKLLHKPRVKVPSPLSSDSHAWHLPSL